VIYTVTWSPEAEQELAAIWVAATNRNQASQASREIDRRLRASPLGEGELHQGIQRLLVQPPLAVVYQVLQDDCKVEVLTVWALPTQP
jgi:plasmid stabilization system protein ParE